MIFGVTSWVKTKRENSNFASQNSTIIKIEAEIVLIFIIEIIVPFSFSQSEATILCLAKSLAKPTN